MTRALWSQIIQKHPIIEELADVILHCDSFFGDEFAFTYLTTTRAIYSSSHKSIIYITRYGRCAMLIIWPISCFNLSIFYLIRLKSTGLIYSPVFSGFKWNSE